ncbi:MAG TPA: Uma2 family endonuclease [Thermoanaerobaculia bacterium]|nr:Uma2 family endonuclease [Thermoanaerobaculia bacterium]
MADPLRKMPAVEERDPFRYGSRWRRVRLPGGEVIDEEIPLTPDDLLDPQPGDEVTQSDPHAQVVIALYELLKRRFEGIEDVVVLFDMKILWGIPGLPEPSPDIAVIRGIPKRDGRSTYKVAEEGALPSLIIEVVSYSDAEMYRNDHDKKVKLYQRVGIPEYLIIDPPFPPHDPLTLIGYRLAADGRYRRIEPDAQGRLHSETTDLLFAPAADRRTVQVSDGATGERLLTASEEQAARKAAEERVREAEAEVAQLRAELERFKKTNGVG